MEEEKIVFTSERQEIIISVASRHLKKGITSMDELRVRDISGMSNQTFIINAKT
jgi:hypothetical protein